MKEVSKSKQRKLVQAWMEFGVMPGFSFAKKQVQFVF